MPVSLETVLCESGRYRLSLVPAPPSVSKIDFTAGISARIFRRAFDGMKNRTADKTSWNQAVINRY